MLKNLVNGIRVILRKQQKKKKPGGRRKRTVANLLNDSFYKALQMNDRLREEVAAKHFGHADVLEKLSPVNLKREHLLLVALEQAKRAVLNNPALLNHFAVMELFKVLGIDPPPELLPMPKKRLTQSERNAETLEGFRQLREQLMVVKEIGGVIGRDSSKGGFSSLLTPEVATQALSLLTAVFAPRQQANSSQTSMPEAILKTPDGISEMSSLEYEKYLAQKGLAGQAAPELEPGGDSQALPEGPASADGDPQPGRPAEVQEASAPASLRISEWATWVDKDPAEFVRDVVSKAAEGDVEAQAALSFLRSYSLQEVTAILEANRGGSADPALGPAIATLLAHQDWLQAVIELIRQQDGAPGEVQG